MYQQSPARPEPPGGSGGLEGTALPSDVGWTGLMTAHMRAVESARPDALFHDPLAVALVDILQHAVRTDDDAYLPTGPDDLTGELTETWYMLSTFLGVRTRYYDRLLADAMEAGVRQVVVLAAGFDARAFRMELPAGTTLFEVDSRPVLAFKERVIADTGLVPAVRRVAVPADLRGPWQQALVGAGFVPGRPTLWLVEGLFMYLSPADCDALLDRLTALSGPGSRLATEYYEDSPRLADVGVEGPTEEAVIRRILSFFQDGPPLPPTAWLGAHGWIPEVTTLAHEITARERRIPLMFRSDRPHGVSLWLAGGRLA